MDETMPIPVTTTRRILSSSFHRFNRDVGRDRLRAAPSSLGRLRRLIDLEQADFKVEGAIDNFTVGREPAVGNPEHQFRAHDTFYIETINELFHGRQHLAGKFDLAGAERPPLAGRAEPAEEKPEQLPQRVDAQAARHHRMALEVTGEKPQVRLHFELGADQAFAVLAALLGDFGNALEHQQRGQWQLRVALAEQLAPPAGEQVLVAKRVLPLVHRPPRNLSDPVRDPVSWLT